VEGLQVSIESTPATNFLFLLINHMLTGAGASYVPLALFTAILASHRRNTVDADVPMRSCGTTLSLLDSSS